MKTSYSQFYNYAKGMYKPSISVWVDLTQLVCDRSMLYPEHVTPSIIGEVLMDAVFEALPDTRDIRRFMSNISPNSYYKWVHGDLCYIYNAHPDYDYDFAVISACLSTLRNAEICTVDGDVKHWLIELDDPTTEVLELSNFGEEFVNKGGYGIYED